jgi:SOS response associated peptidase (SRAP)
MGEQPYAIALADRRLMALAGLWENWRSPAGEWVRSFAIVTTTQDPAMFIRSGPLTEQCHGLDGGWSHSKGRGRKFNPRFAFSFDAPRSRVA